jgi:peptidoglycan/LPS O-acetylase OafA/YrhL
MRPEIAVPTGYRPALDGVRGLAILLVVVDHIGQTPAWHVGHYGVTLFFALSGYLITGLLLDESGRSGGSVSLTRFYLRRAARLLPALLVVVVVCDLLFWALGQTGALKASVAALAYLANYVTILHGDYLRGYGQTWSLAVEEHFYAVWPLALVVLLRRQGLHRALRWTLGACLAALAWRAVLLTFDDWSGQWLAINHGTLARADALLYGCAAALAVRCGWRPRAWMAWASAALVGALTVADLPDDVGATAGQALLAVAGAVLVVCLDHTRTPLRSALSFKPLVAIGAISYGLYLWHYPLLELAHELGYSGVGVRLVAGGLLATALAALSYRWLERPARDAVRAREAALAELVRRSRRRRMAT